MKFEKIMKKFCKDLGIDKITLMTMILGKNNIEESLKQNEFTTSNKDPFTQSKDNLNTKDSITNVNTG